ncbi:MAG: ABC transporter permease [Gammaproteobacteria bacterium]|nr:ABC transporter permease subunit [Gammaproteobacteria bacterium]PCH64966.1 MAG: ABC transporter permease [Gammaproteobacteria bacterium]
MIAHIARHELRSLFLSPLAWVVLALVQLVLAYIFLLNIDAFIAQQDEWALATKSPGATMLIVLKTITNVPTLLMVVIPLITMRMLSDEKRLHTSVLLFSSPISMRAIVLGKYFAVLIFFGLSWLIIGMMMVSLNLGTQLDLGHVAAALSAVFLLLMAIAAIGIYMSSLTAHSAIAAIATFALVLLLWIVDGAAKLNGSESLLSDISMKFHYQSMLTGLVSVVDVAYFFLVTGVFLVLAVHRLHKERVYG